jgi:hypothetical protein
VVGTSAEQREEEREREKEKKRGAKEKISNNIFVLFIMQHFLML